MQVKETERVESPTSAFELILHSLPPFTEGRQTHFYHDEVVLLSQQRELGEIAKKVLKWREGEDSIFDHDALPSDLDLTAAFENTELQIKVGQKARDLLITSNQGLVGEIAKKYIKKIEHRDDIRQYGVEGLIRAVDLYDWRRGIRFSTYASNWIHQTIQRGREELYKIIKTPEDLERKERSLIKMEEAFYGETGRWPNIQEIAAIIGLPPEDVIAIKCRPRAQLILDVPVFSKGGSTYGELLSESELDGNKIEQIDDKGQVQKLLESLDDPRQRTALELYYGLNSDRESYSFREVGGKMGLSHEMVRIIMKRGERNMKRAATVSQSAIPEDKHGVLPRERNPESFKKLTSKQFRYLYIVLGLSQRSIAEEFGVNTQKVQKSLRTANLLKLIREKNGRVRYKKAG